MSRPDYVTDAHLEFLDDLREFGVVNMYGAGEYIVDEFGVSKDEARQILKYWMETFRKEDR